MIDLKTLNDLTSKILGIYEKEENTKIGLPTLVFGHSKNLGGWHLKGKVSISNNASDNDMKKTLVHELAHFAEYKHPFNMRKRGVMHSRLFKSIHHKLKLIASRNEIISKDILFPNYKLSHGMKVKFNGGEGIIKKINRVWVQVKTETLTYRVRKDYLIPVDEIIPKPEVKKYPQTKTSKCPRGEHEWIPQERGGEECSKCGGYRKLKDSWSKGQARYTYKW